MSLTSELQAKVRSLGAAFNLDILTATQEIYRQHLDMTPVEEKANLAYGSDERQRLDLYLPKAAPLAVVVYVHGGGFVGGDKNGDGTFYLNVGRFWHARVLLPFCQTTAVRQHMGGPQGPKTFEM